jgi:hypothetical protein
MQTAQAMQHSVVHNLNLKPALTAFAHPANRPSYIQAASSRVALTARRRPCPATGTHLLPCFAAVGLACCVHCLLEPVQPHQRAGQAAPVGYVRKQQARCLKQTLVEAPAHHIKQLGMCATSHQTVGYVRKQQARCLKQTPVEAPSHHIKQTNACLPSSAAEYACHRAHPTHSASGELSTLCSPLPDEGPICSTATAAAAANVLP